MSTPEEEYLGSDYRTRGTGSAKLPLGTVDLPHAFNDSKGLSPQERVKHERASYAPYVAKLGLQAYMRKCRRGETWDDENLRVKAGRGEA